MPVFIKSRKRKTFSKATSNDSDDAEQEEREKQDALSRYQDEYGCFECAPPLSLDENADSQENKRLRLLELFTLHSKKVYKF